MSEDQNEFTPWDWGAAMPRLLYPAMPATVGIPTREQIALAVLPAMIADRETPEWAAYRAFQYAEAFLAEAKRRAEG
ncbi:MAG: hypothetical protein ING08_08100 [Roseomonas sp.]|nr:hypothetical protein [Roseomonas sp.]